MRIALIMLVGLAGNAAADTFSMQAGLIQPVALSGGNVEVDYQTERLSLDYSHGFSLDMTGAAIVGEAKRQHLVYHLPYSTGLGVGYRITRRFDVRIEPKLHSWQVYYESDRQDAANRIASYKTFTLGLGAYYRWLPFERRGDWLRGILVTPSVRVWPNVASTLDEDRATYQNRMTGRAEVLEAANIGVANTPLLANVSVGYSF